MCLIVRLSSREQRRPIILYINFDFHRFCRTHKGDVWGRKYACKMKIRKTKMPSENKSI